MFNTDVHINSTYYNQNVDIKPACSGILQQSHPNSTFIRFNVGSETESTIFSVDPHYTIKEDYFSKERNYYSEYKKIEVIVLQVLCFGDGHFLCEILDKKYLKEEK